MAETAANDIEWITLFQDPLPDIKRSEEIMAVVWRKTEIKFATDIKRGVSISRYVCTLALHDLSDADKTAAAWEYPVTNPISFGI